MNSIHLRLLAAALAAAVSAGAAHAQSGPAKPSQGPAASQAEPPKDREKDELAEAAKALKGAAGNPECVWMGKRVVALLWRDDLDTALRHLQIYNRFGCPDAHIQAVFRCVLTQGPVDPKVPESLNKRIHACWITPPPDPEPAPAQRAKKR